MKCLHFENSLKTLVISINKSNPRNILKLLFGITRLKNYEERVMSGKNIEGHLKFQKCVLL